MNFTYSITHTEPKSWAGCEQPTDDERLAEWMYRYYGLGHHHRVDAMPNDIDEDNTDLG